MQDKSQVVVDASLAKAWLAGNNCSAELLPAAVNKKAAYPIESSPEILGSQQPSGINRASTVISKQSIDRKKALLMTLENVSREAKSLSAFARHLDSRRYDKKRLPSTMPVPIDQQQVVGDFESGMLEKGLSATVENILFKTFTHPEIFVEHSLRWSQQLIDIFLDRSDIEPAKKDHRFRDAAWRDNYFYRVLLQSYLSCNQQLQQWLNDLELDHDDDLRSRFVLEQLAAALAPSNWPLNPAAVKRSIQTGGKSRLIGLRQFIDDCIHNGGMPRQVREGAYTLGVDLATTPGQVVYRCPLFELLQYQPLTTRQYHRPVCLIPPQINKYYIFDLSPSNSMVRYLLEQGLQVFVVSWRIPSKIHAGWNLDAYVSALEQGLAAVREVSNSEDVNLLSACAGGLTAMALIAYLEAAEKHWVYSHSLFVTSLSPTHLSMGELLITRKALELGRAWTRFQGVMEGKQLSRLFMWLRPNELVWNFWVNNYLMGREPPALDVTFWDSDSTRLPAGLHSDFIDMHINNVFRKPGRLVVRGIPLDFRKITMDMFFLGGTEDYIMPWQGCYANCKTIAGNSTFVLSDGGHIQAVLRPPSIANIEYFTNDQRCATAEEWLAGAQRHRGSWWVMWGDWLQQRSGQQRAVRMSLGSANYPPQYAAPGKYVLERS